MAGIGLLGAAVLHAQEARFGPLLRQTNRETLLRLNAPTGLVYRIDTATRLTDWQSLVSLQSTGANLVLDSATPFTGTRFYRAEQLTGTISITGDHLPTDQGDVVFRVGSHATFVMGWNGKTIYNDPVTGVSYAGLPKADLILVSHSHGDHFSTTAIDSVRGTNTVIIAPADVYTRLTTAQRAQAISLGYNASTNVIGLNVATVPAYNANHPFGVGNGYVVTVGGRRIFASGDTGNVQEIRALQNIDVAFLCMNIPFTMTVSDATNCVRAFRPSIVYPYHYRDQSGVTTNAAYFKQILGTAPGVEVRLRRWY